MAKLNVPVLCVSCARRTDLTGASAPDGETALCSSFPEGIPAGIYPGGGDHRESLHGEPPYQPDPARAAERAEWLAYAGEADWPAGPSVQAEAGTADAPSGEET